MDASMFAGGISTTALIAAGVGAVAVGATVVACLTGSSAPKGVKAPITLKELPRGTMKEVEIQPARTVLLVHTVEGRVFATGPKCSHYNAPLAKGVLNGERIVCPWHGACFNAVTGDIEDGPVLNALPSYSVTVVESSGEIFVEVPALSAEMPKIRKPNFSTCSHDKDNRHFVLIGSGPASTSAVETLRAQGFEGAITLVGKEKSVAYDRPKLSKSMAVKADEIMLRKESFYTELGVTLKLGVTATAVDAGKRSVTLDNGEVLRYDKLLCATGGAPRRFVAPEKFTTPGADLRNIFPLRDVGHAVQVEACASALDPTAPVVIVGSSFIGMEAAGYLRQSKGLTNITVLGMETTPFERVLGRDVGLYMQRFFESKGISFRLGPTATVKEFMGASGYVKGVVLNSGESIPAAMVIIGAGIIPATEYLASTDGVDILKTAPGGIRVNEYMQTGAPDVYAAGDIAYFPFKHGSTASFLTRIEHWDVAFDQGRIAALNMLKPASSPYEGIPFFWTMSMGKSLRYAGHCHKFERVIIHGATAAPDDTFAVYYIAEGKVVAVATVGRDPVAAAAMELLRLDRLPSPAVLDATPSFDLPAYLAQQSLDVAMGTSAATVK